MKDIKQFSLFVYMKDIKQFSLFIYMKDIKQFVCLYEGHKTI